MNVRTSWMRTMVLSLPLLVLWACGDQELEGPGRDDSPRTESDGGEQASSGAPGSSSSGSTSSSGGSGTSGGATSSSSGQIPTPTALGCEGPLLPPTDLEVWPDVPFEQYVPLETGYGALSAYTPIVAALGEDFQALRPPVRLCEEYCAFITGRMIATEHGSMAVVAALNMDTRYADLIVVELDHQGAIVFQERAATDIHDSVQLQASLQLSLAVSPTKIMIDVGGHLGLGLFLIDRNRPLALREALDAAPGTAARPDIGFCDDTDGIGDVTWQGDRFSLTCGQDRFSVTTAGVLTRQSIVRAPAPSALCDELTTDRRHGAGLYQLGFLYEERDFSQCSARPTLSVRTLDDSSSTFGAFHPIKELTNAFPVEPVRDSAGLVFTYLANTTDVTREVRLARHSTTTGAALGPELVLPYADVPLEVHTSPVRGGYLISSGDDNVHRTTKRVTCAQ